MWWLMCQRDNHHLFDPIPGLAELFSQEVQSRTRRFRRFSDQGEQAIGAVDATRIVQPEPGQMGPDLFTSWVCWRTRKSRVLWSTRAMDGSLDQSVTAANVAHCDAGSGSHPPHQWRPHAELLEGLAYVTKDQAETSVLFELLSARYEGRSLLITANQLFGATFSSSVQRRRRRCR